MKKYTIKRLRFLQENDKKCSCITLNGRYVILLDKNGDYCVFEEIHNSYIGTFDELFEAKDKAQEHFENLVLMPYLEQVQDKSHLDIHNHANNWIKNDAEIQLAKERLIRETNLEWTNDYVIQAIQMFVKNLVSEGDINKTLVDFKKYFYNFTKYRINNASTNSKKGKGTNDTRNPEQRLQDALQMFE
jgi:hypothetical protein